MEENNSYLKRGEVVIKIANVANELDEYGYWSESDQLDSTMHRVSGAIDFLGEGRLNELREMVENGDFECGRCGGDIMIMHPIHDDIAVCPKCHHELNLEEEAAKDVLDGWNPYD